MKKALITGITGQDGAYLAGEPSMWEAYEHFSNSLKVIDPAVPPQQQEKPKHTLTVALGFVLGLMTETTLSRSMWVDSRKR